MPVMWSGRATARMRRALRHDESRDAARPAPATWRAAPLRLGVEAAPASASRLVVGHAADPEERRADRVADSVMRGLARGDGGSDPIEAPGGVAAPLPAVLHRKESPGDRAAVGPEGGGLDAVLSGEITSRLGGGSPIPAPLRRSMEGAFGRDLGAVRLHADEKAAQLSRRVAARAFTVGRDVFFGSGEYRPDTADGQHTLAHELAHTGEETAAARRLVIHRTIARGSKEIRAARGVTGAIGLAGRKLAGTKDRLDIIGRVVDDYNTVRRPPVMHVMLSTLIFLCEKYLEEEGVGDAGAGGRRVSIVQDILAEARRDLSKMAAQERYLGDMRAQGGKGADKPGSTAFTKQSGPTGVLDYAQEAARKARGIGEAALDVEPKLPEYNPRQPTDLADAIRADLPRIMAKYGLTEAEVAAIRTFTVQDYQYINPAVAADSAWLDSQKPAQLGNAGLRMNSRERAAATEKHRQPFRQEGATHAGVMMSGLERLPAKKGMLYRGEKLTPAQYKEKIDKGMKEGIVNPTFASGSLIRATAETFGLDATANQLRILYIMKVTNARDIRAMSAHAEQEWVLLPGATFEIVGTPEEIAPRRPGAPGQRIVTLKQIR